MDLGGATQTARCADYGQGNPRVRELESVTREYSGGLMDGKPWLRFIVA